MAQTIWIHKLAEDQKIQADGMDYICEHIFKALALTGKLNKAKGWNALPEVSTKDGAAYRALFCDSCDKHYSPGHVRMAKESVKEPVLV